MHPYYFGDSERPLFGVYHPPEAAPRETAILLCYPLAQEYMRAHRVMSRLARRLAASGFHVMRFDYYGSGDSAGDFEHGETSRWLDDIRTAADELRAMSRARSLALVGLRFGATLAAATITAGVEATDLVLWDPVVSAASYLSELKRMQELEGGQAGRMRGTASDDDILGFRFSSRLRSSIESTGSMLDMKLSVDRALLLASDEREEYARLRDSVEQQGVPITYRCLGTPIGWHDIESLRSIIVAPGAVDAIVEFLSVRT